MNYIAVSLCGHDKDRYFVILYEKDGYAYLADGKTKGLVNLKKKKLKHIKKLDLTVDLSKYNPLYDAHILKELRSVLKKGGCCLG